MRVVVAAPQVPFVRGGAELMAENLVAALRARGHEAELVTVPFKRYPGTRVLDQAFLWRLVDLTEADGRPIDRLIAMKFPAYCVRHPNKVAWVLHQFRQAYDYDRTELGQFSDSAEDRATRRAIEPVDGAPSRPIDGLLAELPEVRTIQFIGLPELVQQPDDLVRMPDRVGREFRRDRQLDRPAVGFR